MSGPRIADGIAPRGADAYVEAVHGGLRTLDEAARALASAYDAELARYFPDLGPTWARLARPNSAEELAAARVVWAEAADRFRALVSQTDPVMYALEHALDGAKTTTSSSSSSTTTTTQETT